MKSSVNDYEVKGPMGSMDPTLPIDLKHLGSRMLGEDSSMRECWEKKNLYRWAESECKQAKFRKPSKRAAATVGRTRLPVEKCMSCIAAKSKLMSRMQKLRSLLGHHFKLLACLEGLFLSMDI